jgi:Flp pilus assembly pilin Flp
VPAARAETALIVAAQHRFGRIGQRGGKQEDGTMIEFLNMRMLGHRARRGATALEYALVLAFVAVGVVAALNLLSADVSNTITGVGKKVQGAPGNIN